MKGLGNLDIVRNTATLMHSYTNLFSHVSLSNKFFNWKIKILKLKFTNE